MAAPTPLSAFTDGMYQTAYAVAWLWGALLVLLPFAGITFIVWTQRVSVRRYLTSKRLHRTHARSGR